MTNDIEFTKIEALRKHLLVSKVSMAKLYGVTRMTYYNWCNGKRMNKTNRQRIVDTTKKLLYVMSAHEWPNSTVYEMSDTERCERLEELLADAS